VKYSTLLFAACAARAQVYGPSVSEGVTAQLLAELPLAEPVVVVSVGSTPLCLQALARAAMPSKLPKPRLVEDGYVREENGNRPVEFGGSTGLRQTAGSCR